MKGTITKILTLILAGIMVFSLTACMGGGNLETLGDEEFCNELWLRLDENVPEATPQGLTALTEEEQTFYVLSDFNFHFQCGGLAQYLYNTQAAYVDEVSEALKSMELYEMAKLYDDFFTDNDINLTDFTEGEMNSETLYEKYPLNDFDDAFYACYDEHDLTKILADFGREHILENDR